MKYDAIVIGAGPAGILSASILNDKGWDVCVLEKQRFPRFVIGESLIPRCMDHLEEAGLLDAVKDKGFQVKLGARFVRGDEVCDFDFSEQYTQGQTWTWQAPRDEFDMTLAQAAMAKGVEIRFESSVEQIDFKENSQLLSYTDKAGGKHNIESRFIIDGSGYGKVIPRLLDLVEPSDFPPRKAVFAHIEFDASDNKHRRIDIITISDKLWAWIIPFSNGKASVGFVGELDCFDNMGDDSMAVFKSCVPLSPYVEKVLGDLEFTMEPLEISAYASSVKKLFGNGFVLTGNSTEFLDPIFSSGVTFAMESGVKAAKLVDQHLRGKAVDWEEDYVNYLNKGVNTFRSYVKGWYDGSLPAIFFAEESLQVFKNQICSVLAGYVWDDTNPFVTKHKKILKTLSKVVAIIDDDEKIKSEA